MPVRDTRDWRPRDIIRPPRDWKNTARHAIAMDCCARCGGEADPVTFRDELSRREYQITGLCQSCQDTVDEELEALELHG